MYQCLASLLQVKFALETSESVTSKAFEVILSDNLYDGIKQAAETYRVSQLDRHFDAVAQLGPSGRWLAERLREHKQNGDMHGIIQLLAHLRYGSKEGRT